MPEHITRCPNCKTSFRIPEKLLHSAKGAVRCGSCLNIFVARNFLVAPQSSTSPTAKPSTKTTAANKAKANKEASQQAKKDSLLISDDMDSNVSDNVQAKMDTDDFSSEFTESLKLSGAKQDQNLFERELKTRDSEDALTSDESWALNLLRSEENGTIESSRKEQALQETNKPTPTKNKDNPKHSNSKPNSNAASSGEHYQQAPPPQHRTDRTSDHDIQVDIQIPSESEAEYKQENEYEPKSNHSYHDSHDTDDLHDTRTSELSTEEYTDAPYAENQEEYDQLVAAQRAYATYEEPDSYLDAIEPEPVELEWKGKGSWLQSSYTWGLLALTFAILLVVQFGWIKFDTYSRIEPYRSYYTIACEQLGCSLPQLIDRRKIKTSKFIVREHPRQTNALMADVILQNNAPFEQIFPAIELIFTDLKNNVVAKRTFQPHEYLGGELAGRKTMPMRQPVHIAFELVDPGPSAVGYRINISK